MGLDPKIFTLADLFNGRLFKIPNYQRYYSWKEKQCTHLFEDIRRSFEKEKRPHFMATVVGLKRGKPILIVTKAYQNIDIVDGQQRITTLVALYKAISKELGESNAEKKVKNDIDEMLVKFDTTVLLLQTNHDTSYNFATYIRKGTYELPNQAETSAERNLVEAVSACEKFVKEWKESKDLLDLVEHLNNKMMFVYHEIDDEALVYSVFEVLNSRGLEVSWFDRLKSTLMGMAFEQGGNSRERLDEIHTRWSRIFRVLGVLPLSTDVLRFAATLYEHDKSRMPSEEKSVELLVERSKGGFDKIVTTIGWIEKVAKSVVKLYENKYEVSLIDISQTRLVAVAIDLSDNLTNAEKIELSRHCTKIAFCVYGICRKDARTAVGEFVRLAYDINANEITAKQIKDRFLNIVKKYDVNGEIQKLATTDCYTDWQNELRYLLYKYEEHLAKEKGQDIDNEQWNRIWVSSSSDTIEHILPQRSGEKFVHYLGNLFLLPPKVNSKLKNKNPAYKEEYYNDTGFLMAPAIIKLLSRWDEDAVLQRGNEIVRWMTEEWKTS